jgi:hypothetical protein
VPNGSRGEDLLNRDQCGPAGRRTGTPGAFLHLRQRFILTHLERSAVNYLLRAQPPQVSVFRGKLTPGIAIYAAQSTMRR